MSDTSVFNNLLSYIEDNLDKDLSLDTISKDLNYSKFYLARIFSEHTDRTIYKYIQGRRLTEAALKLVNTDTPIVEIAYEAGYNSQQAFTLAFGRLYACSPQVYRNNGVFYPKQPRLTIKAMLSAQYTSYRKEGGLAA
jgi:AraC-like DNA-binding protein